MGETDLDNTETFLGGPKSGQTRGKLLSSRSLLLLCLVAALVIAAVVLGCVFGLSQQAQETVDNRQKGILITGGQGVGLYGIASLEKATDLFIPDENRTCSMPDLPEARWSHTMEVVGGTPVICGGTAKRQGLSINTCLQFSPASVEGVWRDYAKLSCPRSHHTSWVTADGEMMQMGGGNCFAAEILGTSGVTFGTRTAKRDACIIQEQDSAVITGGGTDLQVVERYDKNGKTETLPKLNTGRWAHGCGSYLDKEGNTVLVVSGGMEGAVKDYNSLTSTEILKSGESKWSFAESLPYSLNRMGSINWVNTNSILFIGGETKVSEWKADQKR
jgi:hypothetical protein